MSSAMRAGNTGDGRMPVQFDVRELIGLDKTEFAHVIEKLMYATKKINYTKGFTGFAFFENLIAELMYKKKQSSKQMFALGFVLGRHIGAKFDKEL